AVDQARLRCGARADAAGGARRAGDGAADRALLARPARGDPRALRVGVVRRRLLRRRTCARGPVPGARVAAARGGDPTTRGGAVPLLTALPGTALRRGRGRRAHLMEAEADLEHRNLVFALSLLALFVLLAAGSVAVAFIYLAAD